VDLGAGNDGRRWPRQIWGAQLWTWVHRRSSACWRRGPRRPEQGAAAPSPSSWRQEPQRPKHGPRGPFPFLFLSLEEGGSFFLAGVMAEASPSFSGTGIGTTAGTSAMDTGAAAIAESSERSRMCRRRVTHSDT
jgi:hypothetical protein